MWTKIRRILETVRFSHTIFALPFALMAGVMAWTLPAADGRTVPFRLRDLLGIVICMVCARSAAMAFNRLADRDIDRKNPRTESRHLPRGALSVSTVASFAVLSALGFIAATLLFFPNRLPLMLAIPVLAFLLAYSYTKRFTALAHFWLGAALMLAPIAAWIALRGAAVLQDPRDLLPAVILGLAVFFWVAGFDIIYSCQDVEFDRRARLHSIPAALGLRRALHVAALCHFATVVILLVLPLADRFGGPPVAMSWFYYSSVICVGFLLIYEHSIVSPDDLTRVNVAFFNINALISIGLFVVVAVDLYF